MRRIASTLLSIAAALAVGALLAGCGKNATSNSAKIRFLQISPDSGALSVRLNSDTTDFASGLTYETATAYKQIGGGTQEVKVLTSAGTTALDSTYNLAKDTNYTLAVFGPVATPAGILLTDSTTSPLTGNFRIRLGHLASGLGAMDLYVEPAGTPITADNPKITAVGGGTASAFVELAKGDYRVVLTASGSKDALYDSGVVTFGDRAIVTVVAYSAGSAKLANAALLFSDDTGTSQILSNPFARIKVAHAAPDYPFIDMLVDNSVSFSNVPYKGVSSYLTVAAGAHTLKIEPTSVPGSFIATGPATLAGGHDYTVFATDVGGTAKFTLLSDSNLPPVSGRVRVRFVNATTDVASMDVLVNFVKQVGALPDYSASQYLDLAPAIYSLTFNTAGTTSAVLTLPAVQLDANLRYTIYVVGSTGHLEGVVSHDDD